MKGMCDEIFVEVDIPFKFSWPDLFRHYDESGNMIDAIPSKFLVLWGPHNCRTSTASCISLGCPGAKYRKDIWERFGLTFGVKSHNCQQGRYCNVRAGCPGSEWYFSNKVFRKGCIYKKYLELKQKCKNAKESYGLSDEKLQACKN